MRMEFGGPRGFLGTFSLKLDSYSNNSPPTHTPRFWVHFNPLLPVMCFPTPPPTNLLPRKNTYLFILADGLNGGGGVWKRKARLLTNSLFFAR